MIIPRNNKYSYYNYNFLRINVLKALIVCFPFTFIIIFFFKNFHFLRHVQLANDNMLENRERRKLYV